jgi:hypothetical protein
MWRSKPWTPGKSTRESGIVEIRHLSAQAFDGAVEHNDLHLLIPLDRGDDVVELRNLSGRRC